MRTVTTVVVEMKNFPPEDLPTPSMTHDMAHAILDDDELTSKVNINVKVYDENDLLVDEHNVEETK